MKLFKTTSNHVRQYLHSIPNGGKFKNKDIRTYFGTEAAMRKMKTMPVPKTFQEFKKARRIVYEYAANELGNTPAVALKSYIAPELWDKWIAPEWAEMVKKSEDNDMNEFVDSVYYDNLDNVEMSDGPEDDEEDDYDEEYTDDEE